MCVLNINPRSQIFRGTLYTLLYRKRWMVEWWVVLCVVCVSRIRRRLEAGVGSLDRSRCPFGGCCASLGYRTAVHWILSFCGVILISDIILQLSRMLPCLYA